MADNNRNRGSYRNTNQDWDENQSRSGRNQDDDRTYGSSENRGYGNNSGLDEGSSGWQSRYEREDYNRMSGRNFEGDSNLGNSGSDRESGYTSNYGGGNSNYGRNTGRGSRELYDRDYEGLGRSSYSNSGTRLGGANYGNYGDRGRFDRAEGERSYGNYGGYSGSNYGGNFGNDYNNNSGSPGGRNQGDRNWWDRASDEVSSWFGDENAERRRNRDRITSGQHKGKGPKNYSRSDDRIKEDVNDRLSDDPFIDATEIDVTVSSGEVTLTGTVDHRSTKRRAEDLAESVSGVKNVENRIRVGQTSDYRNAETSTGSGTETTGSERTSTTSAVPGSDRSRRKDYVTG
jgi:osmotically-inducible protein OsmY